ncbi:MAG: hypothetical protein PHY45_06850 [Rhodocyclaceae bacterium]|nr:hypothetical protein [Rhodocyclaceae bacterium]
MENDAVRLIALPNVRPTDDYVMTHLDARDDASQFEPHWDKPVADQALAGLTVDEALAKLTESLLESVYGHH